MIGLGTKVSWRSQASGFPKTKVGVVIEVIAANTLASQNYPRVLGTSRRAHESYIVQVVGPRGGKKFYWPRVKDLVEVVEKVEVEGVTSNAQ